MVGHGTVSVHEDIAPANRQSHHEPLLRLAIGKVEQRRGGILREVGDSCFHDGPLLARDDPGDALALLLGHPFQRLHLVCCRVLERAGDDTFFANSELHEEGRLHAGGPWLLSAGHATCLASRMREEAGLSCRELTPGII